VIRVLDGVNAFFNQLASVHLLPLLLAVLVQVVKLGCTSMAWRNVLAAAYPDRRVRRLPIFGAYAAGVGINAVMPVRAGDAVRVVLAHRAVRGSTYTTVVSSSFVLSIFDLLAASSLLAWAALTQNAFPGIGDLPDLPSFDFAWLLDHPLTAELLLAALLVGVGLVGFWIAGHVADFSARVRQAFTVVRRPGLYLRTVVTWQAADWCLRLVTIWLMLDAFSIPQSFQHALLVQVAASTATLLPLTPSGIGTEQAFLIFIFQGAVPSPDLLAFSVGMRLTLLATNAVVGFTAIAITLRTLRYSKALQSTPLEPPRARSD
jgi:uncharacterized membrane protein YbhN (UPF0104 family)